MAVSTVDLDRLASATEYGGSQALVGLAGRGEVAE